MEIINLKEIKHNYKSNDVVQDLEPTINDEAVFMEDGKISGIYLKLDKYPEITNLVKIANKELMSDRVKKIKMQRRCTLPDGTDYRMIQYSTSIGYRPIDRPKRQVTITLNATHNYDSSQLYIRTVRRLGDLCVEIIKDKYPDLYNIHISAIENKINEKYKLNKYFTNSIANFNCNANIHRDGNNIKGALNFIIYIKENASGGHLFVPDYNTVIQAKNNYLLVYPAWKNMHGVTPIKIHKSGGYRNSIIFYSIKGLE